MPLWSGRGVSEANVIDCLGLTEQDLKCSTASAKKMRLSSGASVCVIFAYQLRGCAQCHCACCWINFTLAATIFSIFFLLVCGILVDFNTAWQDLRNGWHSSAWPKWLLAQSNCVELVERFQLYKSTGRGMSTAVRTTTTI